MTKNRTPVAFVIALACFALFATVGASVAHGPPNAFDLSMLSSYGKDVPAAQVLTAAGRFPVYFALCLLSVIFVAFRRAWSLRVAIAIAGLVVVWKTSDLAKTYFHRPRPLHPILAESSFGYPSGHADLSIFFFGLWAWFVWHATLPRPIRIAWVAVSIAWIVAIGWSRLSLGAHFPTDVLGGYLFGGGFLAAAVALSSRASDRNVRKT